MLSPRKAHVKTGNIISPMQEPIKRADHTESSAEDSSFQPNQKHMLVGIPKMIADMKGFSDHHSHIS